jgi:F-type H+-transporting ATPase subunit gamma
VATTREIQRRRQSVENIGKVTAAMEAVSASKMRRAQAATLRSRAYAAKAAEVMAHLRAQSGPGMQLHPLLRDQPVGRPAVILITPDRGLTGGLVLNIIRFAVQSTRAQIGAAVDWIAIGRKGRDFLARHGERLVADFTGIADNPSVLEITPVARMVLEGFLGQEHSAVYLVYADFETVVRQRPLLARLLPIEVPAHVGALRAGFSFEPGPEEVLGEVLPRLLELRIYQALLEAQASEHSARMVAMRNATDAAKELVDDLTLTFNKARQADITSELLDIAGGAEALRQATRS